jgi:biotin synthase
MNEIIRAFAVTRFLLPSSTIKISGGREINLKDDGEELLLSGANGIISSGYLTIGGNNMKKDLEMLQRINLEA